MNRIKIFLRNAEELKDPEYLKLNNKCLRSYIWNHIILRENEWEIWFKGNFIGDFKMYLSEWSDYCNTYFFAKKMRKKGVDYPIPIKPIRLRVSNCPNEFYLEEILDTVDIDIISEEILPVDTIYTVRIR